MKGRTGSYAALAANPPISATVVLDAPTAETGLCTVLDFTGPPPPTPCRFDGTGSKLICG